jgi:hypothetical protein
VLVEEPANVSARQLQVDVAEADGRWLDAARALERLSYLLPSLDERAMALHRAGELHLLRLSDKVSASDCYLKAIDIRPTYGPTLRRLIDYFWSTGDTASAAEMAATLDDEGGFAVPETPAGTRARAALAVAFAGETRRAGELAAALDEGALVALALAATELANRGGDPARVAQALRAVSGAAARLAALRERLAQISDPIAAALASRL